MPPGKNPAGSGTRTPMMTQYLELKAEVGDAILFYRMGDFYEMFFEDAQTAARICDLTLTSRNKSDPDPVPMAGVPWHSAEGHIARLLQAGHRVAIGEQIARPGGKGLMDREIVEILTPGTALAESLLDDSRNNYLVAIASARDRWGLAYADMSTGEFFIAEIGVAELLPELERLAPRELLLPRKLEGDRRLSAFLREHDEIARETMDDWQFSPSGGRKVLQEQWGVVSLAPFGLQEMTAGLSAGGALLAYAQDQRRSPLTHVRRPKAVRSGEALFLDESTLRNLEVLEPIAGSGRHCLLKVLDETCTAMGARALRRSLARPLAAPEAIRQRHDAVGLLCHHSVQLERLRGLMAGIADLERILSRLHYGRARPQDLTRLRDSLGPIPDTLALVRSLDGEGRFPGATGVDPAEELQHELTRALVDDATRTDALICDGYDEELDRERELARGGKQWIADLQRRERDATGIGSLKIGFNKVFGYYIEVTKAHLSRVPPTYQRRQTLVGGERFITPELKAREEKILTAQERARDRQDALVEKLKAGVIAQTDKLQRIASAVGEWDLLASFAHRARVGRYIRPTIDAGDTLHIVDGRHPVVEQFLEGESFVPNDVDLDAREQQILIVTGPNMAGKSTFLRQTGLLVLMAQAGSFIPAKEAVIGVADRIFTRVGASDAIARGQSTFLVEMIETSHILHEATSRSLVLLDEIGRGTSTFDGLAIAWAVAEQLRAHPLRRPRTLFATHFHELTELGRRRDGYRNLNVLVKEWKDQIIFVRRVVPGAADRSYGIHVARLAGLPESVLVRAREVLELLEAQGPRDLLLRAGERAAEEIQMALFGAVRPTGIEDGDAGGESGGGAPPAESRVQAFARALAELNLDGLTPRETMDWLYEWKSRLMDRKVE